MAETHSQVYIHIIMVVKHSQHLIADENRGHLFEFLTDSLRNKNQKPIIVNGTADHIHLFFVLNPSYSVSEVLRELKSNSTTFINKNKWMRGRFCWQSSYAAFSYSQSQTEALVSHISNQEDFHKRKSCREEYIEFLKKFKVECDEEFLFRFPEEEKE
jgi:REP element-mobilizing transposase RayT